MAAKKKLDHKGRQLWKGESQRKKDLIYQYRYLDENNKRKYVYHKDLYKLREIEKEIEMQRVKGIRLNNSSLTVNELLDKYFETKQGVRYSTKKGYEIVKMHIQEFGFGDTQINNVKVSDAKRFFTKLQELGLNYSSIMAIRGVLKPAFQMAFEDDIIGRNPFLFTMKGVIANTSKERKALTLKQQALILDFFCKDKVFNKYYPDLIILLGTGLRVSEFCGLTLNDIDLEHGYIEVNKQLQRTREGRYYVEKTKTKSGSRRIPMTTEVKLAIQQLLEKRNNYGTGESIDGINNFLSVDKNGKPKVALHIENELWHGILKLRKLNPTEEEFAVTPHILRHTFCTNCQSNGMDIKSVQYLMGHSEAQVTADIYAHVRIENVEASLKNVSILVNEKIQTI